MDLTAKIQKLESDLAAFRVAENYGDRQQKANLLHQDLTELTNEKIVYSNLVSDLELALKIKPDVSPERIVALYQQASVVLPDLIVKRLEDVKLFHERLHGNRVNRLTQELLAAKRKVSDLNRRSGALQKDLDEELQFLNAHQALDEYASNSAHLSNLRARKQRVDDYLRLLSQYIEEAQKIRSEMAQDTVDTNAYLRAAKPHLDLLMDRFREYAKELYGSVPAGMTIKNDDGENQCRYNISAHIQNDAADGINQGKIFCYDLLLLGLKQRHSVEFLFHDNRLYADMDKNQRYSLFRLADRTCRELGVQYIATVNEDVIDSAQEIAGEDFTRLFVDPVVLELTDAPDGQGKLLGIQIDMNYEERIKSTQVA